MVDILCGQVGVTVRLFVVMVFQEGVVSAKTHHLQVLMQKVIRTWDQVKKRKAATSHLVTVSFHNTNISITEI